MQSGDTILLGRNRFAVVGLVRDTMNSGGDPAVFLTLADAQVLQSQLAPSAAARAVCAWRSGQRRADRRRRHRPA